MNTSRLIRVVLGATLFAMSDVAEGQPALSIELEDARTVRLSWPVAAGDFVLEETAALSGAPTWTTLPLTPTRVGDQFVVLLVASEEGRYFRLRQQTVPPVPLTTIRESSPRTGESGVAVTRETIVYFTEALASGVTLGPDQFFAEFGGRRLLSRVELSSDRHKATLFFLENLPGSARVRVTLNGDGLTDAFNRPVDFDGDEQPGGSAVLTFETLSITPIPGTAVIGHVFASELQPGPATGTGAVNKPLAGVTITVDGMEQTLRAVTDANGFFKLSPVPGGRFFVHIDGRTVADVAAGIRYPDMAHYPFVGKAWDAVPGRADNLAGGREDTAAGATGKIYLPLIRPGTLQTVSMTEDTTITFPPEVVAANPALQGVTITVPANALFADNGTRGGKVGIAPVPPDRLPGPLPPGLNAALVITVQTDGALNFDQPAPICFPNLPDPLTQQVPPPGSKRELFSFDHDKGIWEPVGSMTVTPDGKLVCSDPGVGIRQPGWHTLAPAGTRNDPPCFSTFEEDLVVVPPDPLRQGLQDHLFVGDEGELLIAVGNNARPIDRKKDPCDPVNRRATPLVVQITTDALRGELFYESLPANATQLLLPGQQIFYKVRPKKLLTDAIIHRSQANILFGNEIRVAGFSYGEGKLLFEDVFYLYRLFDIGDNDHVDGIIDFEKTFADGPEKAVQTKPWALRFGHATKKTVLEMESTGHALGVEFEAHAGQVIFDPVPGAGSRTDILRVRTPAGHVAGTLKTRGEAVAPQKVTFSREDFAEALGQFVDRRPAPILAEQFLALFPADSDGDGFRSSERGFGEKVDALYEATQNKLRGAEGSIFGGLGALVLDALEWVNDDRRQGIYVAPRLAGPFAAGDTITQAGYAADQTGRTIDLMDSLNARYHLSIGAVDPGVEVEFIFEHSISGEVWVPLQSLLIRSEHARFTGIYPQKLVRNFHRARTIHRGEAGGAAYGVVVTGDNNVCDRSITGGCALWADFNKDDFVRYDSDTPPNLVGGLAAQEAMFSPLQKRWLFDQLLNRTRNESFGIIPGGVIVNLDLLAERLLGVPAAQVEDGFTTLLANTIAHEVGHDLGAIHLRDATHDYIEGDLMGRDASNHAMPARFRFFEPLIRQALGFPIFLREANGLWDYYARWEALETYAHNIALPHPNDHPDDLGVPFPVLSVFAAPLVVGQASAAAVTEVNFADTIADGAGGAVSSISLYLVNDGDQPLEVTQVRLRSGDNRFTVTSDVPVPITIPPFDRAEPVRNPALATRRITVHFDPLAAGAAEETLEVVSNSFGGETQAIPLYGRGISAFPEIRLSLVNNNAGGVALGAGNRRVEDFATLSNEGSQELRLTGVRILPAEPPQFSITGLPVVTPDNPLLLQPGQMLPLGFEFDPATPGLQVVKVEFESNDPATPVLRASLVGTGVPDTGAQPAYGMDFVQLQTSGSAGDQVFRVISEAAGGFRFFLPPEVDFRAAWFDPVTGLFAEQSGVTSSSGQPTKLLIPTFGASVAPDRDHDGLPDDIENTVGTSEDHPDSDGDGQDDFVEVVSLHTNPNDGRLTARGALSGVSFSSSVMGVSVGRSTGVAPSDLAVVVTKNGGVAVVDVSNPSQPLALGERKIADGEGRSVLYDPQRNRAYAGFATGALLDRGMFHIADLTDSANPRSVASFPLPAAPRGIAADAERLFLGIGESLAWFDPDTEGFVDSLNLDGGRVTDVAVIARNRLAVMTGNEFLIAVEVDDNTGRLRQKERVVTDGGGGIFYRDPILYTAAARRPIVNSGGYNTVDGRTWQVISRADNPSATILPGQFVAVSDAGLVALFGSTQFGPQMTVLDGSDPTRTDVFQYGNPLLGGPQWIVFAKGLAFVGSEAGLEVVNPFPPDTQRVPPPQGLIDFVLSIDDEDPAKDGFQVVEGAGLPLEVVAQDDMLTASVELFVDGQPAGTALSRPFLFCFTTPRLPSDESRFVSLGARVTDTGGNVGVATPIAIEVIPGKEPPRIVRTNPRDGGLAKSGQLLWSLRFDAELDPDSIGASTVSLVEADAPPPADPIAANEFRFDADRHGGTWRFEGLGPGRYQVQLAGGVRASGGTAAGEPTTFNVDVVNPTLEFNNPNGGRWSDAANWSGNRLPGADDRVWIDLLPGADVNLFVGAATVDELYVARGRLVTGTATLTVNERAILADAARLGGTITGTGRVENRGRFIAGALTLDALAGGMDNSGDLVIERLTLRNTVLRNHGVAVQKPSPLPDGTVFPPRLNLNGSALFHNQPGGRYEAASQGVFVTGADNLVRNEGLWLKVPERISSLDMTVSAPVENAGAIEVREGELLFNAAVTSTDGRFTVEPGGTLRLGGTSQTHSFNGAHRFTGAGTLQLNGTSARLLVPVGSRLVNDLSGASLEIINGTLDVQGVFENIGHARWSGGTISITGEARNLGTLEIVGSASLSGTLVNRGLIQHTDVFVRTLTLRNGTLLNDVTGIYELGRGSFSVGTGTTDNSFENRGLLRKLPATGTSSFSVPVRNSGTLDAGGGTLTLSGGLVQTAGELLINGGSLTGSRTVELQGGVLAGSGTIQASVINAARVAPGGAGAAGTLTITGAYTQSATGILAIELGGTSVGQFDVLAVSGRATLAGNLAVSGINNFAPQVGDQFRVLTYGSRLGEFGQVERAFVPAVGARMQYNARDAMLVIEAP